MIPTTFDYVANLPAEHRDKPKFAAMVSLVTGYYASQLAVVAALTGASGAFDLDTAVGAQLDILGLWIGQKRVVPGVATGVFFGFLIGTGAEGDATGVGFPGATPLGEEGVFNAALGPWYEEHSIAVTNATLDDPTYRRLLQAFIVRNNCNMTGAPGYRHAAGLVIWGGSLIGLGIIAKAFFVTSSVAAANVTGTRQITISVGRALTALETAIVANTDLFPRAAGVEMIVTA